MGEIEKALRENQSVTQSTAEWLQVQPAACVFSGKLNPAAEV